MRQLFADGCEFDEGFVHLVSVSIHQSIEQGAAICFGHSVYPSGQCLAMRVLAKVGTEPSDKRLRIDLDLYASWSLLNSYRFNDLSRRGNQFACFIRRFADQSDTPSLPLWTSGTLRITQPAIAKPSPYKVEEIIIHIEA